MTEFRANHDDLIEKHLDGTLSAPEREAFEELLSSSPQMRADLELQHHIDDALKRRFAPEEAGEQVLNGVMKESAAQNAPRQRSHSSGWRTWLAVAAAILVGVPIGVLTLDALRRNANRPSSTLTERRGLDPSRLYSRLVDAGYTVDWVCETDEQFIEATTDKLDQPMYLASSPRVDVIGWKYVYRRLISFNTQILLTRVDGKPVVVLLDRVEKDKGKMQPPEDSKLRVHNATIGDVILYEISPFEEPMVIELFRIAEAATPVEDPPG